MLGGITLTSPPNTLLLAKKWRFLEDCWQTLRQRIVATEDKVATVGHLFVLDIRTNLGASLSTTPRKAAALQGRERPGNPVGCLGP